MTEVVRQRHRLDEIFVQPQRAGDRTADLRYFERMGQSRPEKIAFVIDEDLGLVLKTAEGGAMDDAVTVALKVGATGRLRFGVLSSTRMRRVPGVGRQVECLGGAHA